MLKAPGRQLKHHCLSKRTKFGSLSPPIKAADLQHPRAWGAVRDVCRVRHDAGGVRRHSDLRKGTESQAMLSPPGGFSKCSQIANGADVR